MDGELERVSLSAADQERLQQEAEMLLAIGGRYLRFTTQSGTTVLLEVVPFKRDQLDA